MEEEVLALLKTRKKVVKITHFPFKIGRNSSNDLIINHDSISKNHAILKMVTVDDMKQVQITDLNSVNGTYLNGVKIQDKTAINTGDIIKFGTFDEAIYSFEMINLDSDKTIIYPSPIYQRSKIKLVNEEYFEHSKVNHLTGENTKEPVVAPEEKQGTKAKKIESFHLQIIKENTFTIEEVKRRVETVETPMIENFEEQIFTKLRKELIPQWDEITEEEIIEITDNIIWLAKQKWDFNQMINALQAQYNSEVTNFKSILSACDQKLQNCYNEINTFFKGDEKHKRRLASQFLIKQVNELVKEREDHLVEISKLKGSVARLETEIKMIKNKKIEQQADESTINSLNKRIKKLEEEVLLVSERKQKESEEQNFNATIATTLKSINLRLQKNDDEKAKSRHNFYLTNEFCNSSLTSNYERIIKQRQEILSESNL